MSKVQLPREYVTGVSLLVVTGTAPSDDLSDLLPIFYITGLCERAEFSAILVCGRLDQMLLVFHCHAGKQPRVESVGGRRAAAVQNTNSLLPCTNVLMSNGVTNEAIQALAHRFSNL